MVLMNLSSKKPASPPAPEPRWVRPVIGLAVFGIVAGSLFGVFEPKAQRTLPYSATSVLPATKIEKGIQFQEVHLAGGNDARVLWIYLPKHAPGQKLPCIFVAPDASTCYYGKKLGPQNHLEHLPYARVGYAVVAYSVDGGSDYFNSNQVVNGITQFRASHCGIDNAHAAVDYALKNLPMVDPKQLYTAGHSSGATMALMAASHDPRIAGCAAYAPACDIQSRVDKIGMLEMSLRVPGFVSFLKECSPITYTSALTCPVFLFHANDDYNVPMGDVTAFLDKLKLTNKNVTFSRVSTGGHSQSMLDYGIPRGIAWLQTQIKANRASAGLAQDQLFPQSMPPHA